MWLTFSCLNVSVCSAWTSIVVFIYVVLTTCELGTAEELFVYGSLSIRVDIPCSRVSMVCWCGSVLRKHCRKLDNESRSTPSSSVHAWERKMIVCKSKSSHFWRWDKHCTKQLHCTMQLFCGQYILNTLLLKFIFLKNNMCK